MGETVFDEKDAIVADPGGFLLDAPGCLDTRLLPGLDGYEVARSVRLDPELKKVYLIAVRATDRKKTSAAVPRRASTRI